MLNTPEETKAPLDTVELADKLGTLARRAQVIELAIGSIETKYDAKAVSFEAYLLTEDIRALVNTIHPMDLKEEIEFVRQDADRRIEELRERARVEACASQTD